MMGTCTIWGLMLNPVAAASFTTTFSFLGDDRELVFDWAGSDLNGDGVIAFSGSSIGSDSELSAWSLRLVESDGSVVFEDVIVENSSVVDFDGFQRLIDFEIRVFRDSFSFQKLNNDVQDVLPFNSSFRLEFIGLFAPRANFQLFNETNLRVVDQTSTVPTTSVSTPEPSLILGFITLGGVMLGSKRKTKG